MAGTPADAVTYAYDGQGRLEVVQTDDGKQTSYQLDPAGNRLQVTGQSGTSTLPTANNATRSVPGSGAVSINLVNQGTGTGLSLVGLGTPQWGTLTHTATSTTYTPATIHPAGTDTVSYTLKDANGLTASALITFNVQTSTVPN